MKIDRSNLVCRFWKRVEDSRARVSIRKGKTTKKLYKTTHTKKTEIQQTIVTKTTGVKRDGRQIGGIVEENAVAKKEEKVNMEDDTKVETQEISVYWAEVEDFSNRKEDGSMIKIKSKPFELLPPHTMRIEYFKIAVYLFWKEIDSTHTLIMPIR